MLAFVDLGTEPATYSSLTHSRARTLDVLFSIFKHCPTNGELKRKRDVVVYHQSADIYLRDLFERAGANVKDIAVYGTTLGKELPLLQRRDVVSYTLIHPNASNDQ